MGGDSSSSCPVMFSKIQWENIAARQLLGKQKMHKEGENKTESEMPLEEGNEKLFRLFISK